MVKAIYRYFGNQIIKEELEYDFVVSKRVDLKEGLDEYLISQNHEDKIKNS